MTTDDIRKVAESKGWDILSNGYKIKVNWNKGTWVEFAILFNNEVEFSQTHNYVTGACERNTYTKRRFLKMFRELLAEANKPEIKIYAIPHPASVIISTDWVCLTVDKKPAGFVTVEVARMLGVNMEGMSNG